MEIQIAVKGIRYSFENEPNEVIEAALKMVKEMYIDEQEFQRDEFEALLEKNSTLTYEQYMEDYSEDLDYRKSFEDNKDTPIVLGQLKELKDKYMANIHDLPKDAVVIIDDSLIDVKGKANEVAIKKALKEKFKDIDIKDLSYSHTGIADKKDILKQDSYEKIGEMMRTKDYKTFLDLRASINKYSSNNIAMIYLQKPDAKAVMGFRSWKDYDRSVVAGQKAISIWQPCRKELRTEEQVDKEIENNKWLYGQPDSRKAIKAKDRMMNDIHTKGATEIFNGYRLGSVFDVSQTIPNSPEKDNLLNILNLEKPLNKNMDNFNEVVQSIKESAVIVPLSIGTSSKSEQDTLFEAVFNYADKAFSLKPEAIDGIKSNIPFKGDMHQVETFMATYLICKHIGIDCEDKVGLKLTKIFDNENFTEEAITIGKRAMFIQSFDRACNLSDQFTKAFDKNYEKYAKELTKQKFVLELYNSDILVERIGKFDTLEEAEKEAVNCLVNGKTVNGGYLVVGEVEYDKNGKEIENSPISDFSVVDDKNKKTSKAKAVDISME